MRDWIVGILIYVIGFGLIGMILFMGGCSTQVEILDGLCYEDHGGSYLCGPEIKPEGPPPEEPIDPMIEYMDPVVIEENTRVVEYTPITIWSDVGS